MCASFVPLSSGIMGLSSIYIAKSPFFTSISLLFLSIFYRNHKMQPLTFTIQLLPVQLESYMFSPCLVSLCFVIVLFQLLVVSVKHNILLTLMYEFLLLLRTITSTVSSFCVMVFGSIIIFAMMPFASAK